MSTIDKTLADSLSEALDAGAPDLEAILADPQQVEAVTEGWEGAYRIVNDRHAAWAMRKRAEREQTITEARALADEQTSRVNAWLEQVTATPARDVAFFDALLTDYARRERVEHDRKTITTPYGAVSSRAQKATATVEDKDRLTAWLKETGHADLITTVEQPPTAAALLKAEVVKIADGNVIDAATGELLPDGILAVKGESVSFTVGGA